MSAAEFPVPYADLEKKLSATADARERIRHKIFFAVDYSDSYSVLCERLLSETLEESKSLNFVDGQMASHLSMAYMYSSINRPDEARHHMERGVTLLQAGSSDEGILYLFSLNFLSFFYWYSGEFAKAFDLVFTALKNPDVEKDKRFGWLYYALGVFNSDLGDYGISDENFILAKNIFTERDYPYGIARANTGLAGNLIAKKKYSESEQMLKEALSSFKELQVTTGITRCLNDLGVISMRNNDFVSAKELLSEAVKIREATGHKQGLSTSLIEMGELHLLMNDLEAAQATINNALQVSLSISNKAKAARCYQLLSKVFRQKEDYKNALESLEKFQQLNNEIIGNASSNQIKKNQAKFEREQSEKEAVIHKLKNVELKAAYEEIEQKNRDILDSIHYAKRIQNSLMPPENYFERNLRRLNRAGK